MGENIRAIRLAANVSLTDVAKRAGITKSTLSKIENGQVSSPISTLVAVASTLSIRLAEFYREAAHPPSYVLPSWEKGKKRAK